jgi:hypothetical protein
MQKEALSGEDVAVALDRGLEQAPSKSVKSMMEYRLASLRIYIPIPTV